MYKMELTIKEIWWGWGGYLVVIVSVCVCVCAHERANTDTNLVKDTWIS